MNGFGTGLVRPGLPSTLGEPDQLLRLSRFRDAHPEVIIGDGGFSTFQARIPEPDGETVITRYRPSTPIATARGKVALGTLSNSARSSCS